MTVCLLHCYVHFHAPWNADFLTPYFYWFISCGKNMVLNSFLENRNGQYMLLDVSMSWRRLSIIHLLESPQANKSCCTAMLWIDKSRRSCLDCSSAPLSWFSILCIKMFCGIWHWLHKWSILRMELPWVRDMLVHRAILKWLYPSTTGIEDALSKGCQDLSQLFSCAMNALPCTLHVFQRLKEVFICIT